MNNGASDISNITQDVLQLFNEGVGLLSFGIISVLTLIEILICPIYVYVYHKNHRRDRVTTVFPLTSHSYTTVINMFWLMLGAVTNTLLAYYFFSNDWYMTTALFILLFIISLLMLNNLIQVQHILLTLLAIQRFLIYFYPKLDKYISFSLHSMTLFLRVLYVLIGSKDVSLLIWRAWLIYKREEGVDVAARTQTCFVMRMTLYILLNVSLLLSALLYIPIFVNIQRLRRLSSSAVQNKPQKYVFYQTAAIVVVKMLSIPCWIFFANIYPLDFSLMLDMSFISDCVMTPFMIQISYLMCNKRNFDTFIPTPIANGIRWMCCPSYGSTYVAPATPWMTTTVLQ